MIQMKSYKRAATPLEDRHALDRTPDSKLERAGNPSRISRKSANAAVYLIRLLAAGVTEYRPDFDTDVNDCQFLNTGATTKPDQFFPEPAGIV